jgi:hypothetical protein
MTTLNAVKRVIDASVVDVDKRGPGASQEILNTARAAQAPHALISDAANNSLEADFVASVPEPTTSLYGGEHGVSSSMTSRGTHQVRRVEWHAI